MFGILNAIFSAGVVLSDSLNTSGKGAKNRSNAYKNGNKTYIDGKGMHRSTFNGKLMSSASIGGTQVHHDWWDCGCEYYYDDNILKKKVKIYGVYDPVVFFRHQENKNEKERDKITLADIRYFDCFFTNIYEADAYSAKKYGYNSVFFSDKEKKTQERFIKEYEAGRTNGVIPSEYLDSIPKILYIPQEDFFEKKGRSFEFYTNLPRDDYNEGDD